MPWETSADDPAVVAEGHWKMRIALHGGGVIFTASRTKPWAEFEFTSEAAGLRRCTSLTWEPFEHSRYGDLLCQDEVPLETVAGVWAKWHGARRADDGTATERGQRRREQKVLADLRGLTEVGQVVSERSIASVCGLSRSTARALLPGLEAAGMIERVGKGGRGSGWVLTEKGRSE